MRAGVAPIVRSRLDRTISELSAEFHGAFSAETVAHYVEDSFDSLHADSAVGEVGVWSAGTQPAECIEPLIGDVLAEIGIKPARAFPSR